MPTTLSGEEYPNLLAPNQTIETVATSVMLASFNWPENTERYRRTAKFVDAFFSKIGEFRKPPRHPKWAELSINVKIPGWERFKAVDDWIAQNATATAGLSEAFESFMRQKNITNISAEERAELVRQFLEWRKTQSPAR